MNVRVVFESRYGNTEKIARAIANGLDAVGSVQLIEANDVRAFETAGVNLLVVGGPTEGHGASPTMRAILKRIPDGSLSGIRAAAFDTRHSLFHVGWRVKLAG